MAKKVIDRVGNGWVTAAPEEGGQIELVQSDQIQSEELVGAGDTLEDVELDEMLADEEDDEEWEDEDDEDVDDFPEDIDSSSEPASALQRDGYHYGRGGTWKQNCIMCGEEFDTTRSHARFCHKVACRQAFNRRENAIKSAVAQIDRAVDALAAQLAAEGDKDKSTAEHLLGKQARQALLDVEVNLVKRLDQLAPGRHPKKEITARPERIDPESLRTDQRAYVLLGAAAPLWVTVAGPDEADPELIHCNRLNYQGRVTGMRILIPRSAIFLRIIDPVIDPDMP